MEPGSQAWHQPGQHLQPHPRLAWPTLPIPVGWGDTHKLQVTGQGSPKLVCVLNSPEEPGWCAGKVLAGLATAAGDLGHRPDHSAGASVLAASLPATPALPAHHLQYPTF